MQYFLISDKAINHLKDKDLKLAKAIEVIGPIKRVVYPDVFMTLVHAIIGQLISSHAQESIWKRFLKEFSPVTPSHINTFDANTLKEVGLTKRKASYIKEIAEKIDSGQFNLDAFDSLNDQEIIYELTKLKGVGKWTAEMVLIFALQRPNIISYKDVAIIRGLKILYEKDEITLEFFEEIKSRYSPYASVASLYLWELSHGKYNL